MLDYWCEKTGTCGPGGWGSGCDASCWMRRIAIGLGLAGGTYLLYRGVKWGLQARAGALAGAKSGARGNEEDDAAA